MNIVVFGCQQIAVDFINFLKVQDGINISLIITYELPLDQTYGYESVIDNFSDSGVEVLNPKKISNNLIDKIQSISPDIIFSVYYRRILPQRILKIPRLGCINIHPSLLPKYRGPTPTAWAIQKGEEEFGITIHLMDEGIDTGDILIQEKLRIYEDETGYELYTRAMSIGANLLIENFYDIIEQNIEIKPQVGRGSYYGKKIANSKINWQDTATNINNLIRVHSAPYNSAETILFNRYILVNKATVVMNDKYAAQGCGKIVDIVDGKLIISCAEECLMLDDFDIFPKLSDEEKTIYFKVGNRFG